MSNTTAGKLPPKWAVVTIGEIACVNPPGSTVTAPDDQRVTFLPMTAVEELTGRMDVSLKRPFSEVKKGFTRFRNGDLLFAKITPCMENGKVAVARDLTGGIGCGSTEFHVVRPAAGISPDYLRYFMVRAAFREEAKRNMQGAVGQQRVPADFIRSSSLPLAPSSEQIRIVSKIDELFSEIEEGERALGRVQELVERYRQSLLKAAVTGELTRDWREEHRGKFEHAGVLLRCILSARREAGERAEGYRPQDKGDRRVRGKLKASYHEPRPPNMTNLSELPDGWTWTNLGQIKSFSLYGPRFSSEDYSDTGCLVLRTSDISKSGRVNVALAPRLKLSEDDFRKYKVERGDLLITRTGSLGTLALFDDDVQAIPGAYLIQFRVPAPDVTRWYLFYFLKSPQGQQQLLRGGAGVGRPNLNAPTIEAIPIPLPPLEEQIVLVDRIEAALEASEKHLNDFAQTASLAASLRQAVLKSAFNGRLVPQETADERTGGNYLRSKEDCTA